MKNENWKVRLNLFGGVLRVSEKTKKLRYKRPKTSAGLKTCQLTD